MNNRKKIFSLLLVGCLLLTLFAVGFTAGCQETENGGPSGNGAPPEPEHLTVGVIMPISGPFSVVGMPWVRGFELYFNKLNAEGGVEIGGTTYLFDVVAEDSQLDPEVAGTAVQKLVFQDGAKFVFGAIAEQCTQVIYDTCAPNGVLHLISWINVPFHEADVSPDKPLCVRPIISPQDSNEPVLEYFVDAYPDLETMALLVPDITLGTLDVDFTTKAEALGIEIVGSEIWELGTTDFVPVMTKLLAYDADAICSLTSAQAFLQLIAARSLGFTGPFISTSPLGPDVFLATAGPELCTDVICAGWNPATATGTLQEVLDAWQAEYGEEPFVSDAALAWDEASILVQAMEKAQSVDPEDVLAALDSMTTPGDLQTGFGPAYMGGLETYGVNRVLVRPIPVSYLMDGAVASTVFIPIEVK